VKKKMMKNRKTLLGTVLSLFVLFLIMSQTRHQTRNSIGVLSRLMPASPSPTPAASFKEIASEPFVPGTPAQDAPRELQGSPACEKQWNSIVQATPTEIVRQIKEGQFEFDTGCGQYEDDFKGIADVTYSECKVNPKRDQAPDLGQCQAWLVLYRAVLIDKMTARETDYSKLRLSVLLNKFIGRMSSQGESAVPELRKMAEEIKHLQPDHPSTYKILASLEMDDFSGNPARGAQICEEGLTKNPNETELHQAWLYFKTRDSAFDIQAYARAHPADLDASYYLASHQWKSGDLNDARSTLEAIVKRDPQSKHFASTLEKARRTNDPKEPIFSIQFNMSPDQW
jgi:hypothetical protein